MKKLILSVLVSFAAAPAFANTQAMQLGSFSIFSNSDHVVGSGCDIGSNLTLDRGNILGNIIVLSDFVDGLCEIYVAPNERIFKDVEVTTTGCGSKLYKAERRSGEGTYKISIVDHRTRICRDLQKNLVVVTFEAPNGQKHTMYSLPDNGLFPIRPTPIPLPPITLPVEPINPVVPIRPIPLPTPRDN